MRRMLRIRNCRVKIVCMFKQGARGITFSLSPLSLSLSLARNSLMDCVLHVLAIRAHLSYESCSLWVFIIDMAKQTNSKRLT